MIAPQKPEQEVHTPTKHSEPPSHTPISSPDHHDNTSDVVVCDERRYLTQRVEELDKTLDQGFLRFYHIWLYVVATLSLVRVLNTIFSYNSEEENAHSKTVEFIDGLWAIAQFMLAVDGLKKRNLRNVNIALIMIIIYLVWIIVDSLGQDFKLADAYQKYEMQPENPKILSDFGQQIATFIANIIYLVLYLAITLRGTMKTRKVLLEKKSLGMRLNYGPYSPESGQPIVLNQQSPQQGIHLSQGIFGAGRTTYAPLDDIAGLNMENLTPAQRNIVTEIENVDITLSKGRFQCMYMLFCMMFVLFSFMVIVLIVEPRPVESDYNYLSQHITYTWSAIQYLVGAIALKKKDLVKTNIALVMFTCFEVRRVYELIMYEKPYEQNTRDDWAYDIGKKLVFIWVFFGIVLYILVKVRQLLIEKEKLKEKLAVELNKNTA